MKKALSIILCLSMLMTSFPASVFAAPVMAPIGGESSQEIPAVEEIANEEQQVETESAEETVLAAEGTVAPIKVLPQNGAVVDYRYPVAYYTFGSDVEINAEDVTLENLGNEKAGGVYYDEENNAIWVFPYASKAMYGAQVAFAAWTSNILAADGSALYFPAVNFTLTKVAANDGTNLVPFGNNEFGWTPFHYADSTGEHTTLEYVDEEHGSAALRTALDADSAQEWDHNKVNVIWKPATTYKVKYSVKFASYSYPGTVAKDTTVTPDFVYKAVYLCSECGAEKASGSGKDCAACGASGTVERDHNSSFIDHTYNSDSPVIGPTKGWVDREFEFATRGAEYMVEESLNDMHFSVYSNPPATGAVEFYVDNVEIYEKVNMTFAAVEGKSALLADAPATLYGYNGDKVTLPVAADYFEAVAENYELSGWTDGKNVYADGAELTVAGCKVLNPVLVPTGEAVTLTFKVPDEAADYYNGPASITVNKDEVVNLDDYSFDTIVGYDVCWTDAEGNVVAGDYTVAADATLAATLSFRDAIVFDSQDKVDSILNQTGETHGNCDLTYNEENQSMVVTPKSTNNYDALIIYSNLAVPTAQYAYIDITLVKNDVTPVTEGSTFGDLFYVAGENTGWSSSYRTNGKFLSEADNKVTYRYDMSAAAGWTGICPRIRYDAYNGATPWEVCAIEFVKDEVIESVEITDVTAPALSATPDLEAVSPADVDYVIDSVKWDCNSTYFGGSTEYTVSVKVKVADGVIGWMFGEETTATINGEEAVVVYDKANPDVIFVEYTFPATEDAKDIEVTINNAMEITENNGTLVLDATVAPVNPEDEINPATVSWAITGGDEGIAELDGNVLRAIWDGTVEITATPDYNSSEAVKFDVVISNQVGWTVKYEAGTGATVTGVPEAEYAKYDYTVSSAVPERAGFGFDGWSLIPGGTEAVDELYVEEDVTLYAMWSRGTFMLDFKKQSDLDNHTSLACAEDIVLDTTGDGYLTFKTTAGSKTGIQAADVQITTYNKRGLNDTAAASNKNIPIDDVSSYEIRFATDYAGSYGTNLYFTSHDGEGNYYSRPYATGVPDYTSNMMGQTVTYSGDINKFITVTYDPTVRSAWKGYLGHTRFDPMQGEAAVGKTVIVDYIKFNGVRAVDYVDVTMPAPVVSADATTVEEVIPTSDAYTIEKVEWSPALVEGKYFDDNTVYTVKITAKAATGYVLSDAPAAGFVNGDEADIEYADGALVVTYTFPATADLQDFELYIGTVDETIEEMIIDEPYGTMALKPIILAGGEITDPNFTQEVHWSISDEHLATIDENGVVTANLDGTVTVTALSKYDPQVKATVDIVLTNQEPERTVTFDKGATSGLIKVPDPVIVKGDYTLPTDIITRSGYHFVGWTDEPGGDEIITEAYITEDTTFYAKWDKLLASDEFDSDYGSYGNPNGVDSHKFEDGHVTMVYNGHKEGIKLEADSGNYSGPFNPDTAMFDGKVKLSDVEYVEVRFKFDELELAAEAKGNVQISVYVQGTNDDGTLTTWAESARRNILIEESEFDGDGFYRLKLPASWHSDSAFKGNLSRYRIHFNTNSYAKKQTVVLDYIRFVGNNVDRVEVVDLVEPVTKAEATSTASTAHANEYFVSDIKWSPELLGGIFYDSATEYKATVTVKALGNYYMPNYPALATINGQKATYKRVDDKTATVTYTFDATEDLGEIELVNVTLHEVGNDGATDVVKQVISGDDFNLENIKAEEVANGYRWIGWSDTEGGEANTTVINVTENSEYYAVYERIEGFDYGNKYHVDGTTTNVDGALSINNGWAVVTPSTPTDEIALITPKTYVNAADYGKVEVIYDGSLETTVGGKLQANRFSENLVPALYFEANGGNRYEATLVQAIPCIVANRVAYKYVYDMTLSDNWVGEIGALGVYPYSGHPAWAVKSINLIKNEDIEEAAVITGIDVPETWGTPDVKASVEGNYVITDVEWTPALNESGKFNPATVYTVAVTLEPASGYKIVTEEATIDGNEAVAEINVDGTMTVSYTYEATAALVEFDFAVEGGVIDVADGIFTLVPTFTPVNEGEEVPVTDIIVEIIDNGDDDNCAIVLEDGSIKAVYDGTITVKVTSVYDPSKTATAEIVITNQVANYTITYVAGAEGVTNMPATDYAKLDYKLSTKVPVRAGYKFAGWIKNPGDTVSITKDYLTSDTTYYALWVKGVNFEFNGDALPGLNDHITPNGVYDAENGVYTINGVSGTDPIITFSAAGLKGSDYPVIEVRVKSSAATNNLRVYYTSSLVPGYTESAAHGFDYSASADEFTTVRIDMSNMSTWMDAELKNIRFDPVNKAIDFYEIDYIRLVNYEVSAVEIDGIEVPKAKAVADTTAESLDSSKVKVTNVSWQPELLYDYYFDGETEYTVGVTVKGGAGYFVSSAPAVYTINGEEADSYQYNEEDETLTLYKTFDATDVIESSEAYEVVLVGADDDFNEVEEIRTIFKGDTFNIGEYIPANIPSGYRWIGWIDDNGDYVNSIVVEEDCVYYAVFEELTEFDYANPKHWMGTTSKAGDEGIRFEENLAIVEVPSKNVDTALITPSTNLEASNYSFIDVYYSATHDGYVNGTKISNIFNATLFNPLPALKFSSVDSPDNFSGSGKLIAAERVMVGDELTYKYTYDMTTSSAWTGNIGKFYADPYTVGSSDPSSSNHIHQYPEWGIRKIVFVPDEIVEDDIELTVTQPEAWMTPDIADNVKVNAPYVVKSIEWADEFNADGSFIAETVYTATMVVGVEAGYNAYVDDAYVNGEYADVVANGDGTYTVTFEFEETAALEEVEVVITGNDTIASAGRYLQLNGKTVSTNGTKIGNTAVTWSVDDESIAKVSANGRVYPLMNGTVVVTATSVYDPTVSADYEVTIVNQGELYTVTFDKNTADVVEGIPEAVMTRGSFVPEEYNITREGYFFAGWSKDEDAVDPDATITINEDTVLYAKWAKGYEWNANSSANILTPQGGRASGTTYVNGIAYMPATTSAILMEQDISKLGLSTAKYKVMQIRIHNPAGGTLKTYIGSKDSATGATTPWNESASLTISGLPANKDGEFQVVTYDYTNHPNWNMYDTIWKIRFDGTAASTTGVAIDWIRLYDYNRAVKFDGNGGLIPLYDGYVESYKQTMSCGPINLRSVPVRDGYTFAGWSKDPESFDKLYNGSFTVSDDVTLYAMWTPGNVYVELDEETLSETVTVEEGEIPEDVEITSDKNGVHVSSESEITPEFKVADEIVVDDVNNTIAIVTDYIYSEMTSDDVYLTFVPEGETLPVYVLVAEDVDESFSGTIVADLSGVAEYAGTITDVKVVFPTGVVENITVSQVAITTAEKAETVGQKTTTSGGERKPVAVGDEDESGKMGTYPTGSGTIVSQAKSTTKTPNKKVTGGSTGGGSTGGSTGGTTTPAASYVETKTAASGDVVFEFDKADDEQLIKSYRHMAKVGLSNSVFTVKNNGRPEGDKNSPAFFTANMKLNAASHRYIVIKNNCTYGADGVRVYFTKDGKYSESMAVDGGLSAGTMGYTVVDMGSNANWNGTITGLFFSFGNKVGNIEIDSIIFTNNKNAVSQSSNKFAYVNSFSATTFTDVKSSDWFYGDVEKSYKMGLMNGKAEGIFDPNGNVTLAEAITVASRVNALYNSKTIAAAANGQKWYDPYVAYATSTGIIKAGQFSDVTRAATRSEVAVMFANAMPASWFTAKNMFTSIPDVPSSDAAYQAILKLYNAGVVVGVDDAYNFQPATNIKRSEISAIINRVVLPESRLRVYTAAELEKMTIYVDANQLANFTLGNCNESKPVLKDGAVYATPKVFEDRKPDPILNCGTVVPEGGLDPKIYKTIEVGVKYGDDVAAGTRSSVFFTTDTLSWSEKGRVNATYDGVKDANGVSVLKFNVASNENWKGTVKNFRFDPFDAAPEFGVVYIKLVPTLD